LGAEVVSSIVFSAGGVLAAASAREEACGDGPGEPSVGGGPQEAASREARIRNKDSVLAGVTGFPSFRALARGTGGRGLPDQATRRRLRFPFGRGAH
ncbi:MAG: hypothetical protein M3N33_10075, partial [Actinomycetota bacterium]|nr:hypothetical protein [Actinomycetota bacterium]